MLILKQVRCQEIEEKLLDNLMVKEVGSPGEWDRYVLGHEKSTYCHLFNWGRVIRDTYNHKCIYLAAVKGDSKNNEKICGILPLYLFKRVLGKPKLVSIPFFDTAGILAEDRETETFLIKKSAVFFSKEMVSAMELRQGVLLKASDMMIPGTTLDIYREKVELHLDLPGSQQKMLESFKSKLRSQIRKGQKNGLVWRIGKRELLDHFYEVFSRNMRDLGSPVHSKKFFDAIFTHFYHHAFICTVFYNSKPVAASFMIKFKKRLANPWASSIREFRHLNSNMFLYWQMIRFACNIGMEIFDMGRSTKGVATYRFKKQWGPRESPLYWHRWVVSEKKLNRFNETLSIEPWKRLPVKVANFIGPMVRRYISL